MQTMPIPKIATSFQSVESIGELLEGESSKQTFKTIKQSGTDTAKKQQTISCHLVLKTPLAVEPSKVIGKSPKHFESTQKGWAAV